jgi:hypothetical protein
MSTLKVVPADLAASSDRHREVAGQVDSALDTDAPVVAAMPAAYGFVGAVFTPSRGARSPTPMALSSRR